MIILGVLLSITAIGFLCWMMFTLASLALPLALGLTAASWAYNTGAGLMAAIFVGLTAAGVTLGLGQFLLVVARPLWARGLIALAFVVPAAFAGYHATHGLVQYIMPSQAWQIIFSVIGGIAVGTAALLRLAGMTAAPWQDRPRPSFPHKP